MDKEIVNKITKSGIINLDLEDYAPKDTITELDVKDFLFEGLILKEKYFRESLKDHNWHQYKNSVMALFCSVNSIIPMWAYMLITSYLSNNNLTIFYGDKQQVFNLLFLKMIEKIDVNEFKDKRVIVKGCGSLKIHEQIYVAITKKIQLSVKSLMFGEACSSVPIYKK
jgi:hypothetical protein|tara:strand:- start:1207 stop:1710 length:504 start_codon:yes stop_codon:yes gene_type:complete